MADLFRIGALVCERDDPSRVGRYLGTGSSYRGASSAGKHLMKELGAFGDYDWEDDFWFPQIFRELDLREARTMGLA